MMIQMPSSVRVVLEGLARAAEEKACSSATLTEVEELIESITGDQLLTRNELAARWGICISTLEELYLRRGMPMERIPARTDGARPLIRFRLADVVEWRQRHQAALQK